MDSHGVREAVEKFADYLYECGYTQVRETVEGNNRIGSAVRDCRYPRDVKTVCDYLKGIAKDVLSLPDNHPKKRDLMDVCEEVWELVKAAVNDYEEAEA